MAGEESEGGLPSAGLGLGLEPLPLLDDGDDFFVFLELVGSEPVELGGPPDDPLSPPGTELGELGDLFCLPLPLLLLLLLLLSWAWLFGVGLALVFMLPLAFVLAAPSS